MLNRKRVKRGKLLVSGKNQVVIETPFRPRSVEVAFTDDTETAVFPSCEEPRPDHVEARVFAKLDGEDKYGIGLSWDVKSPREIAWVARK